MPLAQEISVASYKDVPSRNDVAHQVRLFLFVLAYNLGNFLRRLGLPKAIKD